MKSGERVLAAMRRQPVDRIPFVPNLNGYAIRAWPQRYHSMQRYEILRELGIDLLVRNRIGVRIRPPFLLLPPPEGPLTLAGSAAREWSKSQPVTDKVKIKTYSDGPVQYVVTETPVGSLRCGWQYTSGSPDIPFPIEFPLKSIEDVRTFNYVLDNTVVEPSYEEAERTLAILGDEGTCEVTGGSSPIQDLIELLMGPEQFYWLLADHPAEIEALMDHMMVVRRQEYEVLAGSPAPIVITGENTSTTLTSPAFMARWEFPALNEYSDIVHKTGKIHMIHMCGKLQKVLDQLAGAKFDGIHDAAPPPTGDLDFALARGWLCSTGKCLAGGIDATAFVNLQPDEMEEYVVRRLEEVAPGTGFLISSGDTVPNGTSIENMRAVVRALEKCGQFPIQSPEAARSCQVPPDSG